MTTNHTVEEAAGGCTEVQAALKFHHSNKSSGSGHGCTPGGWRRSKNNPVSHTGQHDDPRSTGEPIVEELDVVAPLQLEDIEGISLHVLEEGIPQAVTC